MGKRPKLEKSLGFGVPLEAVKLCLSVIIQRRTL